MHVNLVTSLKIAGEGVIVDLLARGQKLNLNDLIRGAYTNYAEVTYLSVLEKLVNTVVAQKRNTLCRYKLGPYSSQSFILIQAGDGNRSVEGEASHGDTFLGLNQHVDG